MRVFVTGASGLIGKAVTKELLKGGHTVLGLARSEKAAEELTALGADVQRGSLHDLDVLKEGAAASGGVIHLAFDFAHGFANFAQSCQTDQAAIRAMADALAGSNCPLIITSVTMVLPHGRVGNEDDSHDTSSPMTALRGESEVLAKGLASKGVRTAVMRLPPTCHGDGDDHMFMSTLIATAREKGASVYVGDGLNHWPAVHYLDAAVAYRLALEKTSAGSTFHIVAEEGIEVKDIAQTIGENLGLPIESKSMEEAQRHFGPFASIIGADGPVSNRKTREELGWNPQQCTLLADLQDGKYFKT
ncbi:NAD(P)-binding protein [Mytilinidion resinicola]|uniref:NAD(P)-binding protein n=1 Tax=Mytilinidion resinicola TaxID=574789 RepID=A0A6A6Z8A9_9PEZI|nr:NAD(P)-binding protein [Mytilinidion resinicola]KAF2817362.1 NAD(P)-binding protein [Mytilinidion resinicola]